MEEFSEEEAEYYNECIEKLEKDDYSDTYGVVQNLVERF